MNVYGITNDPASDAACYYDALELEDETRDSRLFAIERDTKACIAEDRSNVGEALQYMQASEFYLDGMDRIVRLWADGANAIQLGGEFKGLLQSVLDRVVVAKEAA